MQNLIRKIDNQLKKPLPGEEYQLKLAPESRSFDFPKQEIINAGVLVLIFPDKDGNPSIVFMKRPSYDGHHSGQISFPGGKQEVSDKSLEETALRETCEELGICGSNIKVIGKLTNLFIPVSSFMVHPYVAWSETSPEFNIDKNEVDYLINIPIHKLLQTPVSETQWDFRNKTVRVPFYNIHNEMVWGATSMILSEFIEVLLRM
jgi:8-oxo-dGTP pyrophosphatase MutT (NUDIX family)